MSKNLLSWVIAAGLSGAFVATSVLYAWALVYGPWWLRTLTALVVFVQGACYFLYGLWIQGVITRARLSNWLIMLQSATAYYVARALNHLFNRALRLHVIPFDSYIGFLNTHSALIEARHQIACAEAELALLRAAKASESEVQQ